MRKMKIITTAVIVLLALVVVLQNTQTVETKILFFTVKAPRVVLLFSTLAVGFIAGLLTAGILTRAKKK